MAKDWLFALVNDAIRKLAPADDPATQVWEFFCECPDVACRTVIALTVVEFDARRAASPPEPILAAEHAR